MVCLFGPFDLYSFKQAIDLVLCHVEALLHVTLIRYL
jgi:hypothetical protein